MNVTSPATAEPGIELISVHVPKCAGNALLHGLQEVFGQDGVFRDYGDRPIDPASPMNLDPDGFLDRVERSGFTGPAQTRAIHGHFHIRKYRTVAAPLRVTFLRDPLDRLISHYFFWRMLPRHGHALHDYVLDQDLSIEQFAHLPLIRSLYTGVFFAGVDMAGFSFIGFHDRFEEDCLALGKLLGRSFGQATVNANTDDRYGAKRDEITSDTALLGRLRALLSGDIAFYDRLRARA